MAIINFVSLYRASHHLGKLGVPLLSRVIDYLIRLVFTCWIPHTVVAGKNLILGYGGMCIVIHSKVILGDNVHIDQGVTLGGNAREKGVPVIEDGVYIGAGAKVLGPIRIGKGSVIGANAVVLKDIPAFSVAVGVPARIVKSSINEKHVQV